MTNQPPVRPSAAAVAHTPSAPASPPASTTGAVVPQDAGALAEFAALREEILQRNQMASNIFVFQLTSTGAIFGFVLSNPALQPLLITLAYSSYLLCSRFVTYQLGNSVISDYIRSELTHKVTGGLEWESWYRSQPPKIDQRIFVHPSTGAFPLPALVALLWAGQVIVSGWHPRSVGENLGICSLWIGGAALTIFTFRLAAMANRFLPSGRRFTFRWKRHTP
jgi:hypothetical protein